MVRGTACEGGGSVERTYQYADDGNQEGDLHQAVEDEEEAANHLAG